MCVRFLVEWVEVMLNTYIYSLWNYLTFSELGSAYPGWIGWISFISFWEFKHIEISASMCVRFFVELVELMLNTNIYSLWNYLAFSKIGSAFPGWIGWISTRSFWYFKEIKISPTMCPCFLVELLELLELMLNTYIHSLWGYIAFSELGSTYPGWIGWITFRAF